MAYKKGVASMRRHSYYIQTPRPSHDMAAKYSLLFALLSMATLLSVCAGDSASEQESEEMNRLFEEFKQECRKEHDLDEETAKVLDESDTFPEEAEKPAKCYVHCMFAKFALIDEEGLFDMDKLVEITKDKHRGLEEEVVRMMLTKCADGVKDIECHCEKAFNFASCTSKKELW